MAVVTLLEHLKSNRFQCSIYTGGVTIKNNTIEAFTINDDFYLWFLTDYKHGVGIDLSNFKGIEFDAIAYEAKTSSDMHRCLTDYLYDTAKYNAYIMDKSNHMLIGFYRIPEPPRL